MTKIFEALKRSPDTALIVNLIEADQREKTAKPAEGSGSPFLVSATTADRESQRIDSDPGHRRPNSPSRLGNVSHRSALASVPVLNEENTEYGELDALEFSIPATEQPFEAFARATAIPQQRVFPFLNDREPQVSEQYRILRTNILQHTAQPKVITISSAASGDGKTLTAINVSGILAMRNDAQVLLIDADLRGCGVAPMLGLQHPFGFADILRGSCGLEQAIVRLTEPSNLHVLTAGKIQENPAELLDSEACRSAIAALRKQFSFIVLDTTPTSSVADFRLVLGVSDGALIVARPDHTGRAGFLSSLDIDPPQKLLGTVINSYRDWFLWRAPEAHSYLGGKPSDRKSWFGRFRRAKARP